MAFITYYCYSVSVRLFGGSNGSGGNFRCISSGHSRLFGGSNGTSGGFGGSFDISSVLSGSLGVSVSGFSNTVSIGGGLGVGGENLQVIGGNDFGGGGGLLDITTSNLSLFFSGKGQSGKFLA